MVIRYTCSLYIVSIRTRKKLQFPHTSLQMNWKDTIQLESIKQIHSDLVERLDNNINKVINLHNDLHEWDVLCNTKSGKLWCANWTEFKLNVLTDLLRRQCEIISKKKYWFLVTNSLRNLFGQTNVYQNFLKYIMAFKEWISQSFYSKCMCTTLSNSIKRLG